jgi:hypothetical protein
MSRSRSRASEAERAYWRKLGDANRLAEAEAPPPASLEEVFERMNAIRARLGTLAEPGLAPDDDAAVEENRKIRDRFLQKRPRGA